MMPTTTFLSSAGFKAPAVECVIAATEAEVTADVFKKLRRVDCGLEQAERFMAGTYFGWRWGQIDNVKLDATRKQLCRWPLKKAIQRDPARNSPRSANCELADDFAEAWQLRLCAAKFRHQSYAF